MRRSPVVHVRGKITHPDHATIRLDGWHRVVGLYWEQFKKTGTNPVSGQSVVAQRRRIKRDFDLPMKDEYGKFLADLVCAGDGDEGS